MTMHTLNGYDFRHSEGIESRSCSSPIRCSCSAAKYLHLMFKCHLLLPNRLATVISCSDSGASFFSMWLHQNNTFHTVSCALSIIETRCRTRYVAHDGFAVPCAPVKQTYFSMFGTGPIFTMSSIYELHDC